MAFGDNEQYSKNVKWNNTKHKIVADQTWTSKTLDVGPGANEE